MNASTATEAPRAARIAVFVLAGIWVAGFAAIALLRLGHPFELDWMGGAFADQVCRVLDGEPLYVAPGPDHVPFLYAPLYFYVSAAVATLTGEGFVPLRLVALGSTFGILALAAFWIVRRTGSREAAAVTVGVHAGGYFLVDTYYDAARADGLFLLLALSSLVVLDLGRTARSAALAAALLCAAYLSKQTALVLAPPFAIAALIRAPRRGACFVAAFAALFASASWLGDRLTDGWFSFYTWTLPRRHQYEWSIVPDVLGLDLRPLWPLFGLGLWLALRRLRHGETREFLADGAWAGGLLLAAVSSRAHLGGAVNVLAPGLLALALVGGLAWREALRSAGPAARLVPLLLAAQLALLAVDFEDRDQRHPPRLIDPIRYLPTAADRAAGERIVAMLRAAEGEVLVPWHGYLARMAGKRSSAHLMAVIDLEAERSGEPELWTQLHRAFLDSARTRGADLVLLDEDLGLPKYRVAELVYPGYAVEGTLFGPGDPETFMPVVGLRTRPTTICRRAR
jgi:hypothetical protein